MKKFSILFIVMVVALLIAALNQPVKKSPVAESALDPAATVITWTAYKTTDKMPVEGTFKEISFEGSGSGSDIKTALDQAEFSIPVASLFTNSSLRDGQIRKSFFGKMVETSHIKGSIDLLTGRNGIVKLTMNGVTYGLRFTYTTEGDTAKISAVMNLDNWNAQGAVESLNDACEDLHAGADGVTMTWSEVKIDVTTKLK
jgi:polyisoprenoid-binding protein YceI